MMRTLEAKLPADPNCTLSNGIRAQQQELESAERDYRAIRREYIDRLLSSAT
jgi:hypothetical protein